MDSDNIKYSGFYKDFMDGRAGFTTIDNVFSNAEALFCEFNDIISPTWLSILVHIISIKPSMILNYIDISSIENMSGNELLRWYVIRKNRNVLIDLKKDNISDHDVNMIAAKLFEEKFAYFDIDNNPYLLSYAYTLLNTMKVASVFIKKFVIYVEQCNDAVDNFITSIFGNKVSIRSGDLVSALYDIPNDSTFVFSDVYKINALVQAKKIHGSSIILADGFGYNYKSIPGNDDDLKVDINALLKVYDFQFNTFNNFY